MSGEVILERSEKVTNSPLADFPITRRWPAKHPDRLQLYTLGTPNGVKISIALEELEIPYEAHRVSFADNDQFTPEFLSLNPNNKIPAILDPNGPGGAPMPLWESGAILLYLADKSGKLISPDPAARWQTVQWLMFQMGGVGPMFGQVGFFHHFGGKEFEDKRPRDRYVNESKRILGVLDGQLEGRDFIVGDYSIADIAVFPWIWNVIENYKAGEILGIEKYANVLRAHAAFMARPAVQRGLKIPARPS
jgi:GST-like protein